MGRGETQTASYYPFGLAIQGLSSNLEANPYLYNGKELHTEVDLDLYDYGWRFYDPVISRFPSLDPLADKFYWVSPYNYAENRPIDGIDLWGLQWVHHSYTQNGVTYHNISAKVNFSNQASFLTNSQINSYQNEINSRYKKLLSNASSENTKYIGHLEFGSDFKRDKQLVPSININTDMGNEWWGQALGNDVMMNIYKKEGGIFSPEEFASMAVLELLHTVNISHPYEITQGVENELVSLGKNMYETTKNTSPSIFYNIMLDPNNVINGKTLRDLWKESLPNILTEGQLKVMITEIHKQMNGAGIYNLDPSYYQYFENEQGNPVKIKLI